MAVKPPSEAFEQQLLIVWLEARNYRFSSIPNASMSKRQGIKNVREGLRKGLPDLLILLKAGKPLWIELKRSRGGRVSPEQKQWIQALNDCGSRAFVARGAAEAIEIVLREEELARGVFAE